MSHNRIHIDPDNVDADGISVAAAVAAAGPLTLGGALTSGGVFTADYARRITITCAGPDVARTFTVTGTDANGRAQTEDVSGASVGSEDSVGYYKTVTSIVADDACAGNISVGTADEFVTQIIPLNHVSINPATVSVEKITGTIEVAIEETFSDVNVPTDIEFYPAATALTDIAVAGHAELSNHATGVRLVCNSYTNTAELNLIILQNI